VFAPLPLAALAMLAFAGNSLLCRLALRSTTIDPATFTSVRLLSGALVLAILLRMRRGAAPGTRTSWASAFALFAYAAAFSFAYVSLPAATGALLLFGAVQVTMVGVGLWRGERLAALQWTGLAAACAGLAALLAPGAQAASWQGSLLMIAAGVAWGVYSLRGRGARDPLGDTAGNFARSAAFTLAMSAMLLATAHWDMRGALLAAASGGIASGLGYAVWYRALPGLGASRAAAVQLTVPVIAALGAIVLLGEPMSLRFAICAAVVLGGVALVVLKRRTAPA